MTWMLDGPGGAAVIRAAQAETLENESASLRLLLDASATHAAVSALRVSLRGRGRWSDPAPPPGPGLWRPHRCRRVIDGHRTLCG